MRLTIEIDTDNAAFEGYLGAHEVARILRGLAGDLEHEGSLGLYAGRVGDGLRLRDRNGNTVGTATMEET